MPTRVFSHFHLLLLMIALLSPLSPALAKRDRHEAKRCRHDSCVVVSTVRSSNTHHRWRNPRLQALIDNLRQRHQTIASESNNEPHHHSHSLRPHSESVTTTAMRTAARHVVVDAGHGGHDSGAISNGVKEKNINLDVALKLRSELIRRGIKVTMIRDDDTFVDLDVRWQRSNAAKADCFVSVHTNDTDASWSPSGIETYYYTSESRRLASCAFNSLVTRLNANGRFVRCMGFRVVKHADIPATLVEMGYIGNTTDRDNLTDTKYQTRLADALAEGVEQFLQGYTPKQPTLASNPKPGKRREKQSTRKGKGKRKGKTKRKRLRRAGR